MAKKLKAIIAKLDDVEEKYRDLYESVDGKFVLSADVEDHPDIANLKSAFERQKKGRGDLEAYKKLGTIEELTEKLETLEEYSGDGKDRPKASELEKQVKRLTKERDLAQGRVKTLEGGIKTSRAEKDVADAITKAGGNPKLLTDTLLKQVSAIEDDEGNWVTVVVDHKGEPRLNAKGERVQVGDVVELLKKDPEYGDAFKGSNMSGSGRQPSVIDLPKPDKTIAANDEKAFLQNLDGIASGKVAVATN